MKDLPRIRGKNLLLGPFEEKYVELYSEWLNIPFILKMTGSEPMTVQDVADYRRSCLDSPDMTQFLVCHKGVAIGDVDLRDIKPGESAQSVIMIANPTFRGCGEEAYRLLLNYGFKNFDLNRIYAEVFNFNILSLSSPIKTLIPVI